MTIKNFYMQDPKNPKRVVTIVRQVDADDPEIVRFQFSVNRPDPVFDHFYFDSVQVESGDQFSKKRGRKIATGRLEKDPMTVRLNGRRHLHAILESLKSNHRREGKGDSGDVVPKCVRRIAAHYLKDIRPQSD